MFLMEIIILNFSNLIQIPFIINLNNIIQLYRFRISKNKNKLHQRMHVYYNLKRIL